MLYIVILELHNIHTVNTINFQQITGFMSSIKLPRKIIGTDLHSAHIQSYHHLVTITVKENSTVSQLNTLKIAHIIFVKAASSEALGIAVKFTF